jgi:nucleoid-associated protein YgaU
MPNRKLAKAVIVNTETDESIEVMYNPEEYRLEQGNNFAEVGIPGLAAPPIQYVRGRARSLSMDLFFDTYEANEDVRAHTGRVVRLLEKSPRTHAPPGLLFNMGRFTFNCVLVDAAQRYTMFRPDGTPVRATISTRFQEYVRIELEVRRGLFVGPPTLHNVAGGETLAALAGQYLGDPTRWREIAEANAITNPLAVAAGTALVVPGGASQ